MDNYKKLVAAIKALHPGPGLPLIVAEVTEITGETCSVKYGDLPLTEVRLKPVITGANDHLLILPKVGSKVLIGSLTGDLKDLAVLRVDQAEKVQYEQNGLKVLIDATDGKVSVANDSTSLKDLFQMVNDIIKNLKVATPSGPSTSLLPDSTAALTQFENKFKTLLK